MRKLLALAFVFGLAACAPTGDSLKQKAAMLAGQAGMQEAQAQGGEFTFQLFERIKDPVAPVRIYIEGDGNAWLTRGQVSPDPTPLDPTALRLAVLDSAPNVAYMARACQYVRSPACAPKYWSGSQFSESMIDSVNQAMNHWKGHKIELVGFSGGAAVALLVAARRDDVISIRTVAGNVDTTAFTTLHGISPLADSLNPALYAQHTALVPQLHFVGDKDTTVPRSIADGYQSQLPSVNCSAVDVVEGVTHYTGWPEQWPTLLAWKLPCGAQ